MGLHLETFAVPSLLEEVRSIVQPAASRNATTLDITVTDGVSLLHADLTKVRQCLLNLLSNACKFTAQGRITLHVTRERTVEREWLLFCVQDTGIGIPAEHLGTLFQEFVQVDTSPPRQSEGTGLGLTISRHFCQMMGGDISVVSTVGQGATFTMRLPLKVSVGGSRDDTRDEDACPHTAMLVAGSCRPLGRA